MCGAFRDIFLLTRNTSTFGRQNVDEMFVSSKISTFERQNVDEMLVARKISTFERHNVDEMFVQGMFVPDVRRFPGNFPSAAIVCPGFGVEMRMFCWCRGCLSRK